jgi:hypothetical protein
MHDTPIHISEDRISQWTHAFAEARKSTSHTLSLPYSNVLFYPHTHIHPSRPKNLGLTGKEKPPTSPNAPSRIFFSNLWFLMQKREKRTTTIVKYNIKKRKNKSIIYSSRVRTGYKKAQESWA